MPGRSEGSTRARIHFLAFLAFFAFFAFLAFLAFLAIASSFEFNGMKRDTRHARRRANLATSSGTDPSRFGARCLALSRPYHGVIHNCRKFSAAKAKKEAPLTLDQRQRFRAKRDQASREENAPDKESAPTRDCFMLNDRRTAASGWSLYQFKTKARDAARRVRLR